MVRILTAIGAVLMIPSVESPPHDLEALQGRWQVIYAETDGKVADAKELLPTVVTIEGNTHRVHVGEKLVAEGVTFEIEASTTPKRVVDSFEGHKIRSIYQLDGDVLMSCSSKMDATEPPDAFSAPAGSGRTFRVLRRLRTPEVEKAVAEEWKRFEGRWVVRKAEMGGQDLTGSFAKHVLAIEPSGRFVYVDPDGTTHGVFVAVPGKDAPGAIDLVFTDGPQAGKTLAGVYSLSSTTYELAVDPKSGRRPASLASGPGSSIIHEVIVREPAPPSP